MNRRDIIILAVLLNAGLIALIFMLAINTEDDKISEQIEITQTIPEVIHKEIPTDHQGVVLQVPPIPVDEVDLALNEYSATNANNASTVIIEEESFPDLDQEDEIFPTKPEPAPQPVEDPKIETSKKIPETNTKKMVNVTVKKGDSLDKIARANGSTVKAIKDANQLKSDNLKIGQVLKVPVGVKAAAKSSSKSSKNDIAKSDVEYYTVKSGDNPWKIAKKFNIKVEDLLKLNQLSEEKARNMKIGDKIRVR